MPGTQPILGHPDVRSVPVFIYGLAEPDTGEIRYVGKSESPKRRFVGHLQPNAAVQVREWVSALRSRNTKPSLVILREVAAGEDSDKWERSFIELHAGPRLLNRDTPNARIRKHTRTTFGPHFSEGARLLWCVVLERRISHGHIRSLTGAGSGVVTRWLYGDMKPGVPFALKLEEHFGVPMNSWCDPTRESFTLPALQE